MILFFRKFYMVCVFILSFNHFNYSQSATEIFEFRDNLNKSLLNGDSNFALENYYEGELPQFLKEVDSIKRESKSYHIISNLFRSENNKELFVRNHFDNIIKVKKDKERFKDFTSFIYFFSYEGYDFFVISQSHHGFYSYFGFIKEEKLYFLSCPEE